jgi:hypothetical protein
LVVAGWVELEVAEEFSGLGVDDADVEVVDDEGDGYADVGAADADVVHAPGSSEADCACGVYVVVADPVVRVVVVVGGVFGEGVVGGGWCSASDAAVGSLVVVDLDELVKEGLELGQGGGLVGLGLEPVL